MRYYVASATGQETVATAQHAPAWQQAARKVALGFIVGLPLFLAPPRHFLLGAKIAISMLFFLGGFWLAYTGFHRAGDALDRVLDGFKRQWSLVGLWFAMIVAGTFAPAGVVIYWLSVYGPG